MPDSAPPRVLSDAERLDWLRLIRSENIGPVTFFELLRRFGSAADAIAAIPELSRRGGRKRVLRVFPSDEARREFDAAREIGAEFVAWGEADYPAALAQIPDAPPVLTVRGHHHLLERNVIAMVGARNASANGVRFARELAAALGQEGYLIVSGLARGIDAAAHTGALESGTAAVMAGGIEVVYPRENESLFREIEERGVIVSEMPLGTVPQARRFPRRNRIVSGMARGVVVVEAALRSGSLITARLAGEQGREVFAVPGSPLDPRCRGTNNLIRTGATLCENADDVMQGLRPILESPVREPGFDFEAPPMRPPTEEEVERGRGMVLEKLGPTAVEIDEIIRQTGLSASAVPTVLLELEIAGRLRRQPGNMVFLV
jgi:DNA processing protein